ncbi:hypothetical protein AADZ91_03435 [Colwelliaceae bacterium 6441]
MKKLLFIMLTLAFPIIVFAQANNEIKQIEMSKIAFLQGQWQGEGWFSSKGAPKSYFNQTENVQFEMDGLALSIQGIGRDKTSHSVIHNAFAVIYYDVLKQQFRMHSYKDGGFLDAYAKVTEDQRFIWGFTMQYGEIRFTIEINDKGQWHEIGEFSKDGKKWYQNFEMTLNKVPE